VLNGALLILGGYLCGPAIPLSPYPRLMLAAHSAGFLASGIVSVLAGLMVRASFTSLSAWGARVAVAGHVALMSGREPVNSHLLAPARDAAS
jgi:hypothetical protein